MILESTSPSSKPVQYCIPQEDGIKFLSDKSVAAKTRFFFLKYDEGGK